jgi:hypothetical protein
MTRSENAMTDDKNHERRWRGRTLFALAFTCALVLAGAAGAATGVLPVGSDIEGGHDNEIAHEHGTDDQHVVARGVSPVAGAWRLTALVHPADENSPAGDCLQLLIANPPQGSPISATMLCQDVGKTDFKADSVPVINRATGESEILLFGSSPGGTDAVDLTADGDKVGTRTEDAQDGVGGRPWVMAVPSGHRKGELTASDEDAKATATLDASRYLDQLAIWERNLDR